MTQNYLIDSVDDAVIVVDNAGIILEINEVMEALLNLPHAVIGQALREAVGDSYRLFEPYLSRTHAHEEVTLQREILQHFDLRMVARKVTSTSVERLFILHDISARKEKE